LQLSLGLQLSLDKLKAGLCLIFLDELKQALSVPEHLGHLSRVRRFSCSTLLVKQWQKIKSHCSLLPGISGAKTLG
jgi:hypothetical protein